MQQRGIAKSTLQSLLDYGSQQHDHRGATIVYFDKKARLRLLTRGVDVCVLTCSTTGGAA
ncbi:MAG: hypothetical protein ACXW2I_13990 [Burkholderiales bacterium]